MSKFQFEARLTCEECFSDGNIITLTRCAILAGKYCTVMEEIQYEHGQVVQYSWVRTVRSRRQYRTSMDRSQVNTACDCD